MSTVMVCTKCGHKQTDHDLKDETMYLPDDKTLRKYECRICQCKTWGNP